MAMSRPEFLGGRGNVDNSVPGYIAMVIATTGMMSLPIGRATYRELGVLRRYRATPLRPQTLLGCQNFGPHPHFGNRYGRFNSGWCANL